METGEKGPTKLQHRDGKYADTNPIKIEIQSVKLIDHINISVPKSSFSNVKMG